MKTLLTRRLFSLALPCLPILLSGTVLPGTAGAQTTAPLVDKHFDKAELALWKIGEDSSSLTYTIVPGEPGRSALQLQYTVQNENGEDGQETPQSIYLSSDALCKLPALSKDKEYVCEIRLKASQNRSMRLALVDKEREHFFTAQQLVANQWQSLTFALTKDFWNAWYEGDAQGSNANHVDFPLSALRFEFLFRQSAGQFKELASGPSASPPERIWVESIKIFAPADAKK